MSTSQFIYYSSSDVGGPGLITGQVGSILTVLDACLVNGYSGRAAAGWTKPFANSGNIGCYKQGSGSLMSLLINDNAPNVTSAAREAWVTGWESIAGIGAPVGTGSGQFPTPGQQLTTGHGVCRKSATADGTGRFWEIWADATTFYFFISTGDTVGTYYPIMFGDIFAQKGASDVYRCLLIARNTENVTGTLSTAGAIAPPATPDAFDAMYSLNVGGYSPAANAIAGHFMPRSYGGFGSSLAVTKVFDASKATPAIGTNANTWGWVAMAGVIQVPNGPDNSLILSPVWVMEPGVNPTVRGRLRGLFQVCHQAVNFADGQTFAGANDYAGKSLAIVKSFVNGGFCAMETSATVETN